MKAIIFDSSSLITLTMNGLEHILEDLKENSKDIIFLLTQSVVDETIERPLKVKRFSLGALRIKSLLDEKVLQMPSSLEIKNEDIEKETRKVLDTANKIFKARGQNINIIDIGEASCLALSRILNNKGIKNIIAIDERTTRVLYEKPENLKNILEKKLHMEIEVNKNISDIAKEFKFVRSSELVFYSFKKGFIKMHDKMALESLLYATKFKGAAISDDEINELIKLGSQSKL